MARCMDAVGAAPARRSAAWRTTIAQIALARAAIVCAVAAEFGVRLIVTQREYLVRHHEDPYWLARGVPSDVTFEASTR